MVRSPSADSARPRSAARRAASPAMNRFLRLLRLLKVHGVLNELIERVHSEFCLIMLGIARTIICIFVIKLRWAPIVPKGRVTLRIAGTRRGT